MITIIKKPETSKGREIFMQLFAVIIALFAAGIVMMLLGYNPLKVYSNIVTGCFASAYRFKATVYKAVPLVLLSLGTVVAFKMKFWNIGAEGQMAMGGFGAAYFALNFSYLPPALLLTLMFLSGALCGAIWGIVPALLKTKFGTSETLVTLMLNYIALKWITYLQYGPWKESGFPKIPNFSKNAILPSVFGYHIGWIFAVAAVIGVYILFSRSKLGYEISVIGESEATSRYAGINVFKVTMITMLISAGLCGITGMIQCSAVERTLTEQFTGGLGFTAVITAWLARLSAPATILTSFLFAMLIQGGSYIETSLKIPSDMASVLQGLIIMFVLGCEFFVNYKIVWHRKQGKEAAK